MTYKDIWIKGLPFKIAFFIQKMWKEKVPVDDYIRRWGVQGPSRCWCCTNPAQETMYHVFLRSYITNMTWSYFFSLAGMNIQGLSLRETTLTWWNTDVGQREKEYFQGVPSIIQELWRRRNRIKYEGENITGQKIIFNIRRNQRCC